MTTSLQFCGDLWLPQGSRFLIPEWMSDGLVFNLEGPITSRGAATPDKICLATDPRTFTEAFPRPPLAACLANNHILDYGREGFQNTIAVLNSMGIRYFGAGMIEDRCNNPLIIAVDGVAVALLGYVCPSTHPIWAGPGHPGVAPIDLGWIREDIANARSKGAQRVIACLHWGAEDVELPKPTDLRTVRALLDMGVDLVIGHHSHCLQPVLVEGERYVFFGLGNAVFPDFDYRVDGHLVAWATQRSWNRTSALVKYLPRTGLVTWTVVRERKGHIEMRSDSLASLVIWDHLPISPTENRYSEKYRNRQRFSHARLAISRFLSRPKWPSAESIAHILRALYRGS